MSKSTNVHWHSNAVGRSDRAALNGHSACCVWLTGLSGSGKSTVSVALERELVLRRGVHARVLDGDNVRHGLCSDLGFGPDDRRENIRRVGEVARLFVDAGVVVIAAFISPCRADRDRIRSIIAGVDPCQAAAFLVALRAKPGLLVAASADGGLGDEFGPARFGSEADDWEL